MPQAAAGDDDDDDGDAAIDDDDVDGGGDGDDDEAQPMLFQWRFSNTISNTCRGQLDALQFYGKFSEVGIRSGIFPAFSGASNT